MARVSIEIAGAAEAQKALLAAADRFEQPPRPLFEALGAEWESSFRQHIRDQGVPDAFAPLAASTVARRKRAGFGPSPILIRTGDLLQSIRTLEVTDSELAVGTQQESAALLQFGGATSSRSAMPGATIPARPFVLLTAQELEDTYAMVEAYYLDDGAPDA